MLVNRHIGDWAVPHADSNSQLVYFRLSPTPRMP